MTRGFGEICGLALAAFLALAAGAPADEPAVVRIGERSVSVERFAALAAEMRQKGYKHLKELDEQGREELLQGIIARELLVLEGLRRGYDREPAIAAVIDKTRRRKLVNLLYESQAVQDEYAFTEDDLRAFFRERRYDTEVLSQHIVSSSEEKAREALGKLEGGASYGDLVPTYSVEHIQRRFGPEGWIGWFKIGEVYEELKEPLAAMEPGSLWPEPVRTAIGHHVFRLKVRRPVDFEPNREWVEKQARLQARADDMEAYIGRLRQRYSLRIDPQVFAQLHALPAGQTTWGGAGGALFAWDGGQLTPAEYLAEIERGGARHPARLDSAGLHRAADNLAGRRIMMAEARRLGLDNDAVVRDAVEDEQGRLLAARLYQVETDKRVQPPTDAEIRSFYDDNIAEFTRADGKVTEFSFLRDSIRTALLEKRKEAAMDSLLAELRRTYESQIEVDREALGLAFD